MITEQSAWRLRRDCKLVHLAITAGACVGSGTIRNLRRDEEKLKEYDEWSAQPEAELITTPIGPSMLRAAIYRFEEERGCKVTELRVARPGFVELTRVTTGMELPVRLDPSVRTGHVKLSAALPAQAGVSAAE